MVRTGLLPVNITINLPNKQVHTKSNELEVGVSEATDLPGPARAASARF